MAAAKDSLQDLKIYTYIAPTVLPPDPEDVSEGSLELFHSYVLPFGQYNFLTKPKMYASTVRVSEEEYLEPTNQPTSPSRWLEIILPR